MRVRKCDPETAQALSKKDKKKLLAILALDRLESQLLIDAAYSILTGLEADQERVDSRKS